ncbi:MAG TPA: TIGR03086 family metal-binding protein [Mycobacteriales bacterium]|nr:TIGR03086 family metal-binding protein [Mycobacteriales bacterium]
MDEVVARFQKAANLVDASLHEITSDEAWSRPTPCADWDVRALLQHVVSELAWIAPLVEGRTIAEVGNELEGDLLGADPLGAFHHHCRAAHEALEQPGALERTVHLSFGDYSGAYYADQVGGDVLVHAWDLARALGRDDTLPDDLVAWGEQWAAAVLSQFGPSEYFATPPAVPDDADRQTRFLASLGRAR